MNIDNAKAVMQFLGTKIEQLSVENDFVLFVDNEDINKAFDVEYEIEDIELDDENNEFIGALNLYTQIRIDAKSGDCMNIDLNLQAGFSYSIDEDADLEKELQQFREMLALNGCATTYSVARSILTVIASQCCAGEHIILPMVNVFKLREK